MAFAAVNLTDGTRARPPISLGPVKVQFMKWTAVSGDTTGTITADGLHEVSAVVIDGLQQSAAATFATNVATIAFRDPSTTGALAGTVMVIGV